MAEASSFRGPCGLREERSCRRAPRRTERQVDEDGKVTTNHRKVVKILSKEGRSEAKAAVLYSTDTCKVREMRARFAASSAA